MSRSKYRLPGVFEQPQEGNHVLIAMAIRLQTAVNRECYYLDVNVSCAFSSTMTT